MNIAIYPGSFDPVTNGHLDVIRRSAALFDRLIVAVGVNAQKSYAFSAEARVEMLHEIVRPFPNVEVDTFHGLLVHYAQARGVRIVVKGLRAISDFEYEFQMTMTNQHLVPEMETVFMMTSPQYSFLSSSMVREVGRYGGNLEGLVPEEIIPRVLEGLTLSGKTT